LPAAKDIPDDAILRARSPKEFLGNAVGHLDEKYPLTRKFGFHLLDNDAKIPRRERAWRNKLKKEQGLSHEEATARSRIDLDSNAITFQPANEMVFMPETVSRMTSGNMHERLTAFNKAFILEDFPYRSAQLCSK
jgi:hypothetical protein